MSRHALPGHFDRQWKSPQQRHPFRLIRDHNHAARCGGDDLLA